jgi:hypothetical protein
MLVHSIVMKLMEGNHGRDHCIVIDNYFTSVGLFEELAANETYATGTVIMNRVGIPQEFRDARDLNRAPQGTLAWRMHDSHGMATVIWKDKRAVVLLSTHALPIDFPCQPRTCVPRRNGALWELVGTSPIHHEYTTHMRGVDVADQLRASYSCQTRSHKWWHRIF